MLQTKTIKRSSIIFASNLIISLILLSTRKGLDSIFFDFVPAILLLLLLPLVSGIMLVLIQDKNRSYEFLPSLLIGSCLNNATIILVLSLTEYFRHSYLYRPSFDFYSLLEMFLPLVALSLFGGLIGLVIRGTTLLVEKQK
jgi:hypothetical protein